mmetsp:Transcript_29097/g.84564  ORF Transcript_29097/g.84564 Transcript_29097/m.84564 type:complete len:218 (+) Transcript_29097:66-719(+)
MTPLASLLALATIVALTAENGVVTAFSVNNGGKGKAPITSQSRSEFFTDVLAKGSAAFALGSTIAQRPALAADAASSDIKPKLTGISNEDLKRIITKDVVDNQFLVSADITREVYDESANFIDEIDTYPMQKWIVGTKRLFVAEKSRVSLVGDVDVKKDKIEFRFDEDLMFRIPLRPVVSLTGRVVLDRDPETGLITKYQEFWDQSVGDVLKTAKFN